MPVWGHSWRGCKARLFVPFVTVQRLACGRPDGHRAGLGPKVPLPSGPHQRRAHPGEATPPAPRGGSLAGRTPGRTGGQGRYWPDFARGVAALCYAAAPSPGGPVRAALPSMSEHRPG